MGKYQFLINLLVISSIVLTVFSSSKASAALISCVGNTICYGTDDYDVIKGSNVGDDIRGLDGNDILKGELGDEKAILGGNGNDQIFGGPGNDDELNGQEGNDKISGGAGNEVTEVGGNGVDILDGGPGNDLIGHGCCTDQPGSTDSDGSKDEINCGAGDDEVWINLGTDHDIVKNCEIVHTERD